MKTQTLKFLAMKTQNFLIATIFFLTSVLFANATPAKYPMVSNTDDLKSVIEKTIKTDYKEPGNFLNNKEINYLRDHVQLCFMINSNKEIKIISAESKKSVSSEYIKQLLDKKQINIDDNLVRKYYKLTIELQYTAF
jgi:hypothetical protein